MSARWPRGVFAPSIIISPWSMESVGPALLTMGDFDMSIVASATWPTANLALFFPFTLQCPMLVKKVLVLNGATASGNWDVGIYSARGRRLASSGSTVQTGTTTVQSVDITDRLLGPGLYYMALALSTTTGTVYRVAPTPTGLMVAIGAYQQASAFPLPATATFAQIATLFVPVFGLTTRDLV